MRSRIPSRLFLFPSLLLQRKYPRQHNLLLHLLPLVSCLGREFIIARSPRFDSDVYLNSRHRAHRARFMASKALASKSSTAIAEILGVPSSQTTPAPTTSSSTPTPYPSTPDVQPGTDSEVKLQELNTSRKSVMDYFKEKLAAKSKTASAIVSSSVTSVSSPSADTEIDPDDAPRGGLGARRMLAW